MRTEPVSLACCAECGSTAIRQEVEMAQDPTTGVWGISAQGLSHCCMECDELVDVVYRDFPRPGQVRGCHALRDNVPFHLGGWLSERRWLVVMMAIFAWCITSFLLRLVEMWYVKK